MYLAGAVLYPAWGELASGGLHCGPAPPAVPSPGSLVYPVSAVRPSGKAFQPLRGVLLTERPSDASLKDTRRRQEAGRLRGLQLPLRWFGVWAPIITCAQSHNQSATTSEGPWGPSEPLLHLSTDFLSLVSRKTLPCSQLSPGHHRRKWYTFVETWGRCPLPAGGSPWSGGACGGWAERTSASLPPSFPIPRFDFSVTAFAFLGLLALAFNMEPFYFIVVLRPLQLLR